MATRVSDQPVPSNAGLAADQQEYTAVQQVMVSEALSQRMVQDGNDQYLLTTFSPVAILENFYSTRISVISDIAAETIQHLQECHRQISESPPTSEDLLELNANIQFLKAVIDIEQTVPRSFKAMFPCGSSKELISASLKERIEYVHSSCDYNLKLYTDVFNKHANLMLHELGWNLNEDENKEELAIIKKWTDRMIVPISLSDVREISMEYPWKNYVIDNQISPEDCKILGLISRLPSTLTPPDRFVCPVGAQVMAFPMRTPCGHVFDKHIIISALRANDECPMDRIPVKRSELVPAEALRGEIHQWLKEQFITITVHAKLPEDSFLAIRGNKAGLNWDKGIPLKKVGPEIWEIQIPYEEGCKYKVLINDNSSKWEAGENHILTEKGPQEIIPLFPVADNGTTIKTH
ncbi:MAG: hypothetical protein JSR39_04300 [Verrucomicrobia bacterium]|nr:hypothetical protein [Verrucomicrobiota bacterium]